jgi:hypothetical protein
MWEPQLTRKGPRWGYLPAAERRGENRTIESDYCYRPDDKAVSYEVRGAKRPSITRIIKSV